MWFQFNVTLSNTSIIQEYMYGRSVGLQIES